jgi:transposase-like protein
VGPRVSSGTVSKLNKKVYKHIETWRNRPIEGEFPYVYLDGIVFKRSWAGEVRNVSVLVGIGVDQDGYRRILGVQEGHKEDKAGWSAFLEHLKSRGLKGVRLIVSDACMGLVEAAAEYYPEAEWQRCTAHFYRNVLSHVPRAKMRQVSAMLKAIHAQESRGAALEKAEKVIAGLRAMRLQKAAELVERCVSETLTYYSYPQTHWLKIWTNNPLERIMREFRRRTHVVGAFPDADSAVMLVAARLRHIASSKWGARKYVSMDWLRQQELEAQYSA